MAVASLGFGVGVLVVSDTCSTAPDKDSSGANIKNILLTERLLPVKCVEKVIVPDDLEAIEGTLKRWCDERALDLVLTVGGTGFTPRDVTPEATRAVMEREAPHLASLMVMGCCEKTKFAALSRGVCGTRRRTLILNLPGNRKGSEECLRMVVPVLGHALDQLTGRHEEVKAEHRKMNEERAISTPKH